VGLPETWNFTGIRSGYVFLIIKHILVSGFNHLEKYESQWEGLSHILWKIKNVPNHQPVYEEC